MDADDRVEDGLPVAVLLVEERHRLAPAAVGEGAQPALEPLPQAWRQRVVRRVHAGEERVAAPARHRERVELGRLERLRVVGAVGVPALGAAAVDRHVERAVGGELVDAEQRDLRMLGMARHLRGVGMHRAEAPAVAQEVVDLQILVRHDQHVVVEPGPIDRGEAGVVQRGDVDPADLGADLRSQAANLDHGRFPPARWPPSYAAAATDAVPAGCHMLARQRAPIRMVKSRPRPAEMVIVSG